MKLNPLLQENPRAIRHTLARLRLCRMQLRRQRKLWLTGYTPPEGDDVQRLWKAAGWTPSRWGWWHDEKGYRPFLDASQSRGLSLPSPIPRVVVPLEDARRTR